MFVSLPMGCIVAALMLESWIGLGPETHRTTGVFFHEMFGLSLIRPGAKLASVKNKSILKTEKGATLITQQFIKREFWQKGSRKQSIQS